MFVGLFHSGYHLFKTRNESLGRYCVFFPDHTWCEDNSLRVFSYDDTFHPCTTIPDPWGVTTFVEWPVGVKYDRHISRERDFPMGRTGNTKALIGWDIVNTQRDRLVFAFGGLDA